MVYNDLHHLADVKCILEHGANPNSRDRFRRSCLALSCKLGFDKIVKLLLVYGARYTLDSEQHRDVKRYGMLVGLLRYHRTAKRVKQMYVNMLCRNAFIELLERIYKPGHCGAKRLANHFNTLARRSMQNRVILPSQTRTRSVCDAPAGLCSESGA